MAGRHWHKPVFGIRHHQRAGPAVRRLGDVEQRPAVHGAASIQDSEQLVIELAHGQRRAVGAGLECGAVDAEFRGEEWLGPDDLFHFAHARVEAIGIVEETLIVVDVGSSVVDGLPHRFLGADRAKEAVWKTIDYATSNVYDYQGFFYDPDGFDARVREMKEVIGSKPFLASELCVNSAAFQTRTYRTALAMGQFYHKLLTVLDACGAMYCWTLLNVAQPY